MQSKSSPLQKYWVLYLMLFPVLLFYVIFHYLPMFGIAISFQDYSVTRGFLASPWVGFKHFISFFQSIYFFRTVRNTLSINILLLIFSFPAPIILALLLNELRSRRFMKIVQTAVYMPHFISLVVVCGIIITFVSTKGIINELVTALGFNIISFQSDPKYFYPVYVISEIWQHIGWDSIIFIAALAGVDQELYEAATMDGAGRFQRMIHISIACILPTITIMLILRIGNLLSVGYEKILLLTLNNAALYEKADVISVYVFRRGLTDGRYSFASAVGLFNSIINCILLFSADKLSKKLGQDGLF